MFTLGQTNELYNTSEDFDFFEGLYMKAYTADFETTTDENDCRVWAYAICDIDNTDNIIIGNNLKDFIHWCEVNANCQLYFHNLAFDGAFIIDYLERNNWRWVDDSKSVSDKTYTTLISDVNQVYCITLYFTPMFKVKIYDSLKIIPLSVDAMAKAYKLPINKLSIDYEEYREIGHELTDIEQDYIKNDVRIVAMVLKDFLNEGLTKMTAGSNALYDFKKMMGGNKGFRKVYPELSNIEDEFIRKAYRGGFTYVNPRYQGIELGDGIVFDVNSLYPSVMAACEAQLLPQGKPTWFDGEPMYDRFKPLWVAQAILTFDIKENHIPCIQIKGNSRFKNTEYLEHSDGEVTITFTNIDWELMNQQYDIKVLEWFGGYRFGGSTEQFKPYVAKWIEIKNQATIDGNAGLRQIAKLELNSLYGKFATRIEVLSRKPVMVDNIIRYIDLEPETRSPVYLPVGVFITSYARYKTITSAQSVYDRFVYADTDSLHLIGTEIPDCLDIDPVRLGAWKHESTFDKAKFLRAKCYVEHEIGAEKLTVHVSGMPKNVHEQVDIRGFRIGAEYEGKLYQKRVPGGVVLIPGEMKIRE